MMHTVHVHNNDVGTVRLLREPGQLFALICINFRNLCTYVSNKIVYLHQLYQDNQSVRVSGMGMEKFL